MTMNKVMKGTALTALAAATWLAAGTTDAAAKDAANPIDAQNIYIDTAGQSMDVTVDDDDAKEVHIGIGTYNKNKKTVKVSAWDVYEIERYKNNKPGSHEWAGYSGIDLSKLNNTKDNYIAVKTDQSDPVYIKIPAAMKGQKAEYNAGNSELTIKNLKGVTDTEPKNYNWEYRTPYGSWEPFSPYEFEWDDKTDKEVFIGNAKIFEQYQQQGATLYIRSAATSIGYYYDEKTGWESDSLKPSTDKVEDANDKSTDKVKYPLYESGSFPGKESKFSIKKQANGPAVGIDYLKNTVKLAKDSEFRMIIAGEYFSKDEIKGISDNTKEDVEKFFAVATTNAAINEAAKAATSGVLEVRKAADPNKKKSASKWTIVKLAKPEGMTFVADKKEDFDKDGNMITTGSAVTVKSTTGGSISVKYEFDNKGKYKGKVTVNNSGNFDFQVIIKSSDPTATDKAVTIKKGASKAIKASKNDKVYVRKAGDKKEKTFAGKYVAIATLNQ